ncbi:ATP-binding cassette domain-containing protein [Flammeovirga pectinis]|uniref:ATP-binding cassette domain-containing protein n=1 Tax=Flammeovirga pectinis TaxID=2494373 RepID=A0A3S9P724_9BACT|nr:ABC transporter transmembrane domain-containing protein [Flammeovirga pectinis]AZQ63944.1 ATP-binding cassette domain-containing protein [Flammeovirga pectinis]
MKNINYYSNFFFQQHGFSDCGIACLKTIIKFYGGKNISYEELRILSDTNEYGTSLDGLSCASNSLGIDSEGYEYDIKSLKETDKPSILYVIIDKNRKHYIVCFGWDTKKRRFIISDPSDGVKYYTEDELLKIWEERILLKVSPNSNFQFENDNSKKKLKWIIDLISSELNILFVSSFLGLLIAIISLSNSIFIRELIDSLLPKKEYDTIFESLTLLAILLSFRLILNYLRDRLTSIHTQDFKNSLISFFYSKIISLPISYFDFRETGEVISRLNDTKKIQKVITSILSNFTIDVIIVGVSSFYIYTICPKILYILSGSFLAYISISYFTYNRFINFNKISMQSFAQSESQFINTIEGIREVKSNIKELLFINLGINKFKILQKKIFKLSVYQYLVASLLGFVGLLTYILTIYFGVNEIEKEKLSIGDLMAIISIMIGLQNSMSKLSMINILISEAKVSFDRIFELANIRNNKSNETIELPEINTITLQNLTYSFPGSDILFNTINANFKKGQVSFLIGESGIGKSIILKVIQKYYEIYDSNVIINNKVRLDKIDINQWLGCVAIVNQEPYIFKGTIAENISMNFNLNKDEINNVITFCKRYGFDNLLEKYTMSYFTKLETKGINISGGQRQIIAFARAIYKNPRVLLLDEPSSALDDKTEEYMMEIIQKIKQDRIIIGVTHRRKILEIADEVIKIERFKEVELV